MKPTLKLKRDKKGKATRLIFKCDFSDNVTAKLVGLGTFSWIKEFRAWSSPLEPAIFRRLLEYFPEVEVCQEVWDWANQLAEKQQRVIEATQDTRKVTERPLWGFQMASVRFLHTVQRGIIGHKPGTGKTPISSVGLDYTGASRSLIVCPDALKWTWVDHIRDWSDQESVYVMESKPIKHFEPGAIVLSGVTDKRDDALSRLLTTQSIFTLIINYDQLRIHQETLAAFDYDVLIADESHRLINRKALRTEAFKGLCDSSAYVWLLTGTPVRNHYDDLFSLLAICDPDRFGSYWNFVKIHLQSVPKVWGGIDIIGLRDPESFNAMLSTYLFGVTKEEVMPELPKKIYSDIRLPMTTKQMQIYHQMEQEFLMSIEKQMEDGCKMEAILTAPTVVAQIIRLRQICLNPAIIGGPSSSAKINALKDLLPDIHGSFIIFSWFRKFLPFVAEVLKELDIPYREIVGGQSSTVRREAEQALNSGEVRTIIGTAQSMGEGLNLQKATTEIFCDTDWVPANNEQAEDRVHRGEIVVSPTIIRLFHPGTVEADIRAACRRKEKVIEETTGRLAVIREMLLRKGRR